MFGLTVFLDDSCSLVGGPAIPELCRMQLVHRRQGLERFELGPTVTFKDLRDS